MELYCKDCGAPIQYGGRGPHPKRCKECQKKHLAEVRKAYTKTPKGHAVMLEASRKYRKTPKGQKRAKKFNETYQPWYRESEHGKAVRAKGRAKRRALKAGAEHEPWTREEIIKRDNGVCQICGLPVYDYDDAPNRLKPQIDHIVPISAGGADKADNLRLTHAFCNNHKHAGEADVERCKSVISSELEALAEKLL